MDLENESICIKCANCEGTECIAGRADTLQGLVIIKCPDFDEGERIKRVNKRRIYRLVGFVRVEPENQKPMTLDEAKKEQEHCETMQPENIYVIERAELS